MIDNQELVKQIIENYADGKIDFENVPALKEIVVQASKAQVISLLDTTVFRQEQEKLLAGEEKWVHAEISQIVQKELKQLDVESLQANILKKLAEHNKRSNDLLESLNTREDRLEKAEKLSFWTQFIPALVGFSTCLLFIAIIFFLLKSLIYDGFWKGWGLNLLYKTTIAIQPAHPYLAVILGLLGIGFLGGAIFLSSWSAIKALGFLFEKAKINKY